MGISFQHVKFLEECSDMDKESFYNLYSKEELIDLRNELVDIRDGKYLRYPRTIHFLDIKIENE